MSILKIESHPQSAKNPTDSTALQQMCVGVGWIYPDEMLWWVLLIIHWGTMKEGKFPPCICCWGWEQDWKQKPCFEGILVRKGLAKADGTCSLRDPPLSLSQTEPEAQIPLVRTPAWTSTSAAILRSCLPACCTVLALALPRQDSTAPCRSCGHLWDEQCCFQELPESHHWVIAPSTDIAFWRQRSALWICPLNSQGSESYCTAEWRSPRSNGGGETAVHSMTLW